MLNLNYSNRTYSENKMGRRGNQYFVVMQELQKDKRKEESWQASHTVLIYARQQYNKRNEYTVDLLPPLVASHYHQQ